MSDEHQLTELYEEPTWIDPVQTKDELPQGASNLTMCFVETERTVYWVVDGKWQSRSNNPQ